MSRAMRSVFEVGAGELSFLAWKLRTQSFFEVGESLNREVKEELFSGVCLSVSKVLSVLLKH